MNKIKELYHKIKGSKWTPYWAAHAVISLAISLCFLSYGDPKITVAAVGVMFYLGREIAQLEEKGYFDYKGLLAPIAIAIILYHFM